MKHLKQAPLGMVHLAILAFFIFLMALITGCTNATVIKLADMCHQHEGKPSVTFSGDTGKVACQ